MKEKSVKCGRIAVYSYIFYLLLNKIKGEYPLSLIIPNFCQRSARAHTHTYIQQIERLLALVKKQKTN